MRWAVLRIHGKVSTRQQFKKIYADASSTAQKILRVDEAGLYDLAVNLTRIAEKDRPF